MKRVQTLAFVAFAASCAACSPGTGTLADGGVPFGDGSPIPSGGGGGAPDGGWTPTTSDGGGSTQGDAVAPGGRPPTILSLTASPSALKPGGSVTISAVVSDPDGLGDLAGGTLADATGGQTYGAFGTPGGQGTFTYALTWDGAQAVRSLDFPGGGGERTLLATFFDAEGHTSAKTLSLEVVCTTTSEGICAGECVDLQTSSDHCGACDHKVSSTHVCVAGNEACPGGQTDCGGTCLDLSTDQDHCGTCTTSCTSYGKAHNLSSGEMVCDKGACRTILQTSDSAITNCSALCATHGLTCSPVGQYNYHAECDPGHIAGVGCAGFATSSCAADQAVASCGADETSFPTQPGWCGYPGSYPRDRLLCACE